MSQVKFKPNSKHQLTFIQEIINPANSIIALLSGRQAGKSWAGAAGLGALIYRTDRAKLGLSWVVCYDLGQSKAAQDAFVAVFGYVAEGGAIKDHLVAQNAYILRRPGKGHGLRWNCDTASCTGCYRVEFKTAENPDALRGRAVDALWFDEAAHISEYAYQTVLPVILASGGPIFCTTTPKGKNWFYERIFMQSLLDPSIKFIRATMDDNPALNEKAKKVLKSQYSGIMYQQEILGEFKTMQGLVYPFDEEKDCYDPTKLVLPPGEWVGGIDFGFKDPFVYLWVLKGTDGIWYATDEVFESNVTIDKLATIIKMQPNEKKISRRWADPSRPDLRAMMDAQKLGTWMAKNDIQLGVNLVAKLFEQGRLKISRKCINGVRELSNYQWKKQGEVPQDKDNHFCDALRYVVASEEFLNGGATHDVSIANDDGSVTLVNDGETQHVPQEGWGQGKVGLPPAEHPWIIDGVEYRP